MKCGSCGWKTSARFCSRCGEPVQRSPVEPKEMVFDGNPASTSAPPPSFQQRPGERRSSQQDQRLPSGAMASAPRPGAKKTSSSLQAHNPRGGREVGPQETLDNLQNPYGRTKQAPTEKGEYIRLGLEAMMEDYYGPQGEATKRGQEYAEAQPSYGNRPLPAGGSQPSLSTVSPMYQKEVSVCATVPSGWRRGGPRTAEGRVMDASDRNLLCMDVHGDNAVVGSADHGLKMFNIRTGKQTRTLYAKNYGHTDWVTSCCFLQDGRVLSAGMDSKLCLWHPTAPKCDDLLGHTGSITQVAANGHGIAVSSSFDRTLRVWNCPQTTTGGRGRAAGGGAAGILATLSGHTQPVTQFIWYHSSLISGDRKGDVMSWDIEASTSLAKFSTGGGQIGSMGYLSSESENLCLIGDLSGTLSIYDLTRQGPSKPIFKKQLHPGGSLTGVKSTFNGQNGTSLVVTAGADKRMLCLEPRQSFTPVLQLTDHKDFIYSLETFGSLILSGAGNGWLLVHDSISGSGPNGSHCLFGLGANTAAVRAIHPAQDVLVAAGDDGKLICYDF